MLKLFCDICDKPMKKDQHRPQGTVNGPTVVFLNKSNTVMTYQDVCWPCIGAIDSCVRELKGAGTSPSVDSLDDRFEEAK